MTPSSFQFLLYILLLSSSIFLASTFFCYSQSLSPTDFIIMEGERLLTIKSRLQEVNKDKRDSALSILIEQAEEQLKSGPYTVVNKKQVPPSGSKNDYISMGPYWWPDPNKEDGLPYIRRDGEVNPEYYDYTDTEQLEKLMEALKILSVAYFYTEEEKYASHAISLFRTWFIAPETKMNPHLKFGQRIPGITEGRRSGIIDTRSFVLLPDYVRLLSTSTHWDTGEEEVFKEWMADFVHWLVNSVHGKEEAVHGNNHSTWYFTQILPMALYLGQGERADSLATAGFPIIMEEMIEEDGTQPKELGRTRTWDYSTMNLLAMFYYARANEHLDKDLWNYTNQKGGTLKAALDYLVPYADGKKEWPHKQITPFENEIAKICLNIGTLKFENKSYFEVSQAINSPEHDFHYLDVLYLLP
ncbi:alginate lyase family protein [Pleomorphovibrio marinus]|uniref:alginate lyase family protein n=1 Tax=Pleomorphovibrio marinus TaxID=2164132 RepID=UPI00130070FE|nr:alginate lyase family protein [Pleomorphovibrio marinus]